MMLSDAYLPLVVLAGLCIAFASLIMAQGGLRLWSALFACAFAAGGAYLVWVAPMLAEERLEMAVASFALGSGMIYGSIISVVGFVVGSFVVPHWTRLGERIVVSAGVTILGYGVSLSLLYAVGVVMGVEA